MARKKQMNGRSRVLRESTHKPLLSRRPMPLGLLVLLDLLLIGIALIVFALFHHVIPRREEAVGVVSQRISSAVQLELATAAPEPTAVPATAAPEPTAVPVTAAPELTAVPVTAVPAAAVPVSAEVSVTDVPESAAVLASEKVESRAAAEAAKPAERTEMPAAADVPAAADEPSPAPTQEPAPEPEPVGWFGTKFADKFSDGEIIQTENSYQSAYLNVSVENVRDLGTEIYIADIYVKDISCFQTSFADDTFGRGYGEWLRDMAKRKESVVAVNGDYCGGRSNGIVIRNGMLYREDENPKRDVCVLYWDGTMQTFSPDEFDTETEMARGAYQVWNFGPELLDENGQAMEEFNSSVKPRNPRTAIGYYEPGHYCLVVIDGRSYQSIGMTMKNLSLYMQGLGCSVAYNLDGGESSEMVWGTERYSIPYKNGRQMSDAVLIIDK